MRSAPLVDLLLVGAGGFAGSVARHLVSGLVYRLTPAATFPWGTLVVNVAGCLLIGLAAGLVEWRQLLAPPTRLFLMVGLLGGFTTFSTFGYETLALARDGEALRAAAVVLLQVGLGLGAVWLGMALVRG